jgi:hypothetical protein
VPNIEAAIRYASASDPEAWVDYNRVNLGVSMVKGTYRVFKNDAGGNNIRVNKPNVWGIAGEYAFRFGKQFGIQGEVYAGQALGNYLGTIRQTTKGEYDDEISSTGFWVKAVYYWKKILQTRFGYGQDACNKDDLKGIGIQKNQTVFANLVWDINKLLQISAEPTWRKTTYLGLKDNSGLGIMVATQLRF